INIVSNLSGIGIHTIRKWEQRYKVLTPEREENGRRLYTEKDIEKLQLLNELTSAGHSISKVAALNNNELKTLLERTTKKKVYLPEKLDIAPKVNPEEFLKNLFFALENYKLDIISHELSKAKVLLSGRTLVMDILLPLFKEVGVRISNGQISMAQELALFSIIKFHLGQIIFKNYERKIKKPQIIVFATLENDPSEIEILLSSVLSSDYGIKFYYLGAGLPVNALVEAAKSMGANLIVLGVNELLKNEYEKIRKISIERLLAKTSDHVFINVIGGNDSTWSSFSKNKRFIFFKDLKEFDATLATT
ncbi:MAG: MerR family transcriptional regulator, partial [Bacteriovoracales bacterium]